MSSLMCSNSLGQGFCRVASMVNASETNYACVRWRVEGTQRSQYKNNPEVHNHHIGSLLNIPHHKLDVEYLKYPSGSSESWWQFRCK